MNPFPNYPNPKPFEPMSKQELELLELRAHDLLLNRGVELKDVAALEQFDAKGVRVDKGRVYPELSALHEILKSAPECFTLHARNDARSVQVGESHEALCLPCYGAPNVRNHEGIKRLGTLSDYQALVKLAHSASGIGNTGWNLTFPHDVNKDHMHLDMALAHLELSDKSFTGAIHSADACQQLCDLQALVLGRKKLDKPYLLHMFNPMSPLSYPDKPLQSLRVAALNNQACVFAAYVMMGMTSPMALAAGIAQAYAEVLTGAALTQLYKAGTAVVVGAYTIPFSMKAMQPNFSESLSYLAQQIALQLFRKLDLPVRAEAGLCTSNSLDYQAAVEARFATQSSQDADLIMHSAGWLESGRCIDMKKFQFEASYLHSDQNAEADPISLSGRTLTELKEQIAQFRQSAFS